MRRSLLILATLALSSALYAQTGEEPYTREKVLEIFSQYNPSVLENAQQNEDYNAILESFLASYNSPQTPQNRYELIAVARNFDNSIRLKSASLEYEEALIFAQMSGMDPAPAVLRFRKQLLPIFQQIWAVTIQLRDYEISELKQARKVLRKNRDLSKEARAQQDRALKDKITALERANKELQKNAGEQILSAIEAQVLAANQALVARLEAALAQQQAQDAVQQALQTSNLQVKTKNKKPVAK